MAAYILFAVSVYIVFVRCLVQQYRIDYVKIDMPKQCWLPWDDFKENMDSLKPEFDSQTSILWKVIGSASVDIFKSSNPQRPAVILLAGGPETNATLDRLATQVSTCYEERECQSLIEIDGMKYIGKDAGVVKRTIDDKLKVGFGGSSKVAVIYHLESIPAEAAMIFHSYCENDYAPFKDVVIIFTVHTTETINPEDDSRINQQKVEKLLKNQWKNEIDIDHIEAMFSRVATSAAFVAP